MNHSLSMWAIPAGMLALLGCGIAAVSRRRKNKVRRMVRRAEKTLSGMASAIRHMAF